MIYSACKKNRLASSEKLRNSLEKNQPRPPQKNSLVFLLRFLCILRWVTIIPCIVVDMEMAVFANSLSRHVAFLGKTCVKQALSYSRPGIRDLVVFTSSNKWNWNISVKVSPLRSFIKSFQLNSLPCNCGLAGIFTASRRGNFARITDF